MGGTPAAGALRLASGRAAPPALPLGDKERMPLKERALLWHLPPGTSSALVTAPLAPLSVTSSPKTAFSQPSTLHKKQSIGPIFTLRRDVLTHKSLRGPTQGHKQVTRPLA